MENITISILGHESEGQWEVVALEMDLFAYGDTFEAAIAELQKLIENQLSFAHYKNDPDLAFKSAPIELFALYAELKAETLRKSVLLNNTSKSDYCIGGLPLPDPHIIADIKDYSLMNA